MTLAAAADATTVDGARSNDQGVAVVDTTELRWFASGELPADVGAWFTRTGTVGAVEERYDRYRLDDQAALGVKRRFGTTLEMKMRQSLGERLALEPGLEGRLEVWRKWTPAGGFAESSAPWIWLDVNKRVVKRRFSVGGNEIEHSPDAGSMEAAGCDAEIVSVEAGEFSVWSLAFAAFGPVSTRRDALLASWQALRADYPDLLRSCFGLSCGYPEWLTTVAAARSSAGG
jgi:hypothetical protein